MTDLVKQLRKGFPWDVPLVDIITNHEILADHAADEIERLEKELVMSQARETKLREVLKRAKGRLITLSECVFGKPDACKYIVEALAMPHDDTALREALHHEWKKGLRDAVGYLDEQGEDFLRMMAKGE